MHCRMPGADATSFSTGNEGLANQSFSLAYDAVQIILTSKQHSVAHSTTMNFSAHKNKRKQNKNK